MKKGKTFLSVKVENSTKIGIVTIARDFQKNPSVNLFYFANLIHTEIVAIS